VIKPLERTIWEIDDFPVEYVYPMGQDDFAIARQERREARMRREQAASMGPTTA